jgi:hypothetical protein
VTGTTFGDLVTAAVSLISSYVPIVVAGAVLSLGGWFLRRLVRSGR